jgi:hypothetical protein
MAGLLWDGSRCHVLGRSAIKDDAGLLSEWNESTRKVSRTKELAEWDGRNRTAIRER